MKLTDVNVNRLGNQRAISSLHLVCTLQNTKLDQELYIYNYIYSCRHLHGSTVCNFHRLEVPEQVLGGVPQGLGIVVEDKPSQLSYTCIPKTWIQTINQ